MQALDKGTLGTAVIMGWMEDVGADSDSYAATSTAFWAGVVIGEPIVCSTRRPSPLLASHSADTGGGREPSWTSVIKR